MAVLAYLRVSLEKLNTDNQRATIADAGFAVDEWICEEGVSGSIKALDRPAFVRMMSLAKSGDTCICTMVDRLGRSASDVLHTVEEFKRLGIKLRVMQFDGVDVTSSMGKLILTVMAACAELEKNLLSERTTRAMKRIKDEGIVKLGPPLKIAPDTLEQILVAKGQGLTLEKISNKFSIPRNTLQKNVAKWGNNLQGYRQEYDSRVAQHSTKKLAISVRMS